MKYFSLMCLLALASSSLASDEQGLFLGGGTAVTVTEDCTRCDSDGYGVELGYNFNKFVGVEVKQGKTEFEYDSDIENEITYYGVNIGHTFNTSWIRVYGKFGYLKLTEEDAFYNESWKDSGTAYGVGVVVTPFDHQSGLYIKLESVSAEIFDDVMGYGQFGIGYQF